ncbi:MAG: DUF554 domain-containing protein [Clostridia bacterium]
MLGTIVNAGAIIAGGLIGATVGGVIKERYKNTIMQGIALAVVVIGLSMALEGLSASRPGGFRGEMLLLMIFSVVLGGIIGEWIDVEARLEQFGKWIQLLVHKDGQVSTFAEGFVIASLVYCVGSMAIMGSIQDGLNHDPSILYAKSVLDGVSAVIFASTLGFGVLFSFVPVFVYQGAITLLASLVKPLLIDWIIIEMSAVGGILIIGIGLTMLEIKKIKVGNLLPSIFIPIIYGIVVTFTL